MHDVEVLHAGTLSAPGAYVTRTGGSHLSRLSAVLRPGDATVPLAVTSFMVRHPSAGAVLIDTGLHPQALSDLRSDFGAPMALAFRSLRPAAAFDGQLRALGLEPDEVGQVVMTHLHVDHTSGMRLLPRAEFVCSRAEWAAARGRFAVRWGYVGGHLPPETRMRLVDLAEDGEPDGPFERTLDLLGDGTIRLIATPGHSPGHLSVLVRLGDGPPVLLVGDAAYTVDDLREERLPLLTEDDDHALASLHQLNAFLRSEPETIVVPSHDPEAWRALAGG